MPARKTTKKTMRKTPVKEEEPVVPVEETTPVKKGRRRTTKKTEEPVVPAEEEQRRPTTVPEPLEVACKTPTRRTRQPTAEQLEASELQERLGEQLTVLTNAQKELKKLLREYNSLFKRASNRGRPRQTRERKATMVFDQALVDYLNARLDKFVVKRGVGENRREEELPELTTDTLLFRTDLCTLLSQVFHRHGLHDPTKNNKKTNILYSKDKELMELITTSVPGEKYADHLEEIRNGTYPLTLFNIQGIVKDRITRSPSLE